MNLDPDGKTDAIQATDEAQAEDTAVAVVETEADENLVDEAYAKIETVFVEKMNAIMEEVGAYLLDTFFDGDTKRAQKKDPVKEASFKRLIEKLGEEHPSFGKKSWLYNAINIAIDAKLFRDAEISEYEKLGLTHKVYLTHVKDFDEKVEIAREAAEKAFTTRHEYDHNK